MINSILKKLGYYTLTTMDTTSALHIQLQRNYTLNNILK